MDEKSREALLHLFNRVLDGTATERDIHLLQEHLRFRQRSLQANHWLRTVPLKTEPNDEPLPDQFD